VAVSSVVKVRGRGLSLQPIGYAPALSVTLKAPLQPQLLLVALYKCYVFTFFTFTAENTLCLLWCEVITYLALF